MKSLVVCVGIALSFGACKKSGSSGPGGGGPPPSSWLVGDHGLMVRVETSGEFSQYPIASTERLNGISCRFDREGWVVGTNGTLLYTGDGGASWQQQQVPTRAELRAVATQDTGPLFAVGDGAFLTSPDSASAWTAVGDGTVSFRAVAAAKEAQTVLALSEDGVVFSFDNGQLVPRSTLAGARAIAVSPDGRTAVVVGDQLVTASHDGGVTWAALTSPAAVRFDDVRFNETGSEALAVGTAGALAHISDAGGLAIQQLGTADLHAVRLEDTDQLSTAFGIAAGDGGHTLFTFDGGTTWREGPSVGGTVLGLDQVGARSE